jgi:hypothetical protein
MAAKTGFRPTGQLPPRPAIGLFDGGISLEIGIGQGASVSLIFAEARVLLSGVL